MYWYSESNYGKRTDWRPRRSTTATALHSDRRRRTHLAPALGSAIRSDQFFSRQPPEGFRPPATGPQFRRLQDDGAFYNRRPSLWVEPLGKWGDGAVQLVEIPTEDEVQGQHRGVLATEGGRQKRRCAHVRLPALLASRRTVTRRPWPCGRDTRQGRGGIPGLSHPKQLHKFVIDFEGGPLSSLQTRFDVAPVVDLSAATANCRTDTSIKVVGTSRWRAFFDVLSTDANPIDIRCYLRLAGKALTETWLYQFFPSA